MRASRGPGVWHHMWRERQSSAAAMAGIVAADEAVVAGRGPWWPRTVAFQTGYAGSIPVARSTSHQAILGRFGDLPEPRVTRYPGRRSSSTGGGPNTIDDLGLARLVSRGPLV